MLNDPRVSACIVIYHSGQEVLQTIRCVRDSQEPVTLFVVDNAPGDGTARSIQRQYPSVPVIAMERNEGYGRANNRVLSLMKSVYHIVLNPDITFEPDLVGRMVAWMDEHPDVVILTPRVLNPDGTEQFLPKMRPTIRFLTLGRLDAAGEKVLRKAEAVGRFAAEAERVSRAAWEQHDAEKRGLTDLMRCNRLNGRMTRLKRREKRLRGLAGWLKHWRAAYTLADNPPTEPTEVQFATGCFLLIRSHAFYKLKGFDERFFLYQEDSDLTMSARRLGKVVYHPDMCVTHAWHRDSSRSFLGLWRHVRSTWIFFRKWGWKW